MVEILNVKSRMGCLLALILSALPLVALANENADTAKKMVTISHEAQQNAKIQVETLQPQRLISLLDAPGEVVPDTSLTTKISSFVNAKIMTFHVQEGQHVKANQPLVQLTSIDMAKTQGNLFLAAKEWERVKELGKDAVSAKRYNEAEVNYQQAYNEALAYGMTPDTIQALLQQSMKGQGTFQLVSPRDGIISNITMTPGDIIEAGRPLMQVTAEAKVWIEAKLPPDIANKVSLNQKVHIVANKESLLGYVIQVHHQLDEITRTRSILIEVPNAKDILHPGQFVNCQIESGYTDPLLAIPNDAILLTADGDSAAYIEIKPNQFQQAEVKVRQVIGNQTVIEGLSAGARVVTQGAFFVHSELNKSQFGDDE